MEPAGQYAEILLALLREAAVPVVVVTFIGTAIALYQFFRGLGDAAAATQDSAVQLFASSGRRVRAYGLFIVSHALATTTTVGVAHQLLQDEGLVSKLAVDPSRALASVTAGLAAYFLIVDWWSLRQGDTLPAVAALSIGLVGVAVTMTFGAYQALQSKNWFALLPWTATAFLWFKSFGWASSTGSALARAIQNHSGES